MPATQPPSRVLSWRWSTVIVALIVWTALGLISVAGTAVTLRTMGRDVAWAPVLTARLADWYSCALFTPVFVWLARRWPIVPRWWVTRVPAWLAVTTVVVPVKYAIYRAAVGTLIPGEASRPLAGLITINFVGESLAFWAMVAVIYAVEYYDGDRQRDVQTAILKAELAEARLQALGAQLQPHFLFNTLQGISTLLHRDALAADQMLNRLSELLRRAVDESQPESTLTDELALLGHYTDIQRARFGDRLVVDHVVPTELGDALVPRFILQPLVENAIRHGVGRRAGAGRIHIAATRQDGRLRVSVADDGPGLATGVEPSEGVGLSNTRRRLAALYGDGGVLEVAPRLEGGTCATITLPYRTENARR